MKFSSYKELELELAKVTNRSQLVGDITVTSQGIELTLDNLGEGSTPLNKEWIFMGRENPDMVTIKFTENGSDISVDEVKVKKA